MKEVVSVSLGSSSRDRRIRLKIGTETVRIGRIGTDGDIRKAKNWIRRLDGRVDAIGLGEDTGMTLELTDAFTGEVRKVRNGCIHFRIPKHDCKVFIGKVVPAK